MRDARFRDLRTIAEIRDLYRFPSDHAARVWLTRHQVPRLNRGRRLLVDTRDVDAALVHSPHRRPLPATRHFQNLEGAPSCSSH